MKTLNFKKLHLEELDFNSMEKESAGAIVSAVLVVGLITFVVGASDYWFSRSHTSHRPRGWRRHHYYDIPSRDS